VVASFIFNAAVGHVPAYGIFGHGIAWRNASRASWMRRARLDVLPDIPIKSDFLPGFEASAWQGGSKTYQR
jgi:hypothetical protein